MRPSILDWELTDAPELDEAPWSPEMSGELTAQTAPPPGRSSRWLGWLAGGLLLGVMLGTGLWNGWNAYRLRRSVEGAVVADNSAVPAPIRALHPAGRIGQIESVTSFATDIVKVNVTRDYAAPDGTVVAFVRPQFYRLANGAWQRIPLPPSFWGDEQRRLGTYSTIDFNTVDATFVGLDFGPYLDGLLAQTCVQWNCPAGFRVQIDLTRADAALPLSADLPVSIASNPLVFGLLSPQSLTWAASTATLFLASPQVAGIPADASGAALQRHALASQVLLAAGSQLVGLQQNAGPLRSAFFLCSSQTALCPNGP